MDASVKSRAWNLRDPAALLQGRGMACLRSPKPMCMTNASPKDSSLIFQPPRAFKSNLPAQIMPLLIPISKPTQETSTKQLNLQLTSAHNHPHIPQAWKPFRTECHQTSKKHFRDKETCILSGGLLTSAFHHYKTWSKLLCLQSR